MTESHLQTRIAKALPSLLGALKVVDARSVERAKGPRDLAVRITTPAGRSRWLRIRVKPDAVPSRVRETARGVKTDARGSSRPYPVVASTFLSPRVRQICQEEGVGYLDLAGNCRLALDDFHFEKVVERNPFPARGRPASLFSPVSSRVVRAMLEEPERRWRVLELAEVTDVSLGQASNVCRRLLDDDYVRRAEDGLSLRDPAKLIDAWSAADTLACSRQLIYYSFDREPERLMKRIAEVGRSRKWPYALTGSSAASLVAPFVHGVGLVQCYIHDARAADAWVAALNLRPVEAGPNIALVVPFDRGVFYRQQAIDRIALVGNVQLYLDLVRDPARGREQADFLRQQKLGF